MRSACAMSGQHPDRSSGQGQKGVSPAQQQMTSCPAALRPGPSRVPMSGASSMIRIVAHRVRLRLAVSGRSIRVDAGGGVVSFSRRVALLRNERARRKQNQRPERVAPLLVPGDELVSNVLDLGRASLSRGGGEPLLHHLAVGAPRVSKPSRATFIGCHNCLPPVREAMRPYVRHGGTGNEHALDLAPSLPFRRPRALSPWRR